MPLYISIITFIERINIGNARIQGLEADFGLTGVDYNIAPFISFVHLTSANLTTDSLHLI